MYTQHFALCDRAKNASLIFYYAGYFSQNIINAIGDAVRLRIEKSDPRGAVRRKLFSTFIEMAQNIVHYSAEALTPEQQQDREMRAGSVCISQHGEEYFIMCSNPVTLEQSEALRHQLETIRAMSLDEIKQEYRRQLRDDVPEQSKGAGLGFLTIAKDSRTPIDFIFEKVDDNTVVFSLSATI